MIICEFSENMQNSKMLKKMLNFKDVWFATDLNFKDVWFATDLNFKDVWFATDLIASREYSLDIHVKINTTRLLVIYAFFLVFFNSSVIKFVL